MSRFAEFGREPAAEGAGPSTIGQDLTYVHGVLVTGGALLGAPVGDALAA